MAIEVLSSEIVFEGKVFDVRVDQVRLAGDRETRIDIVIHSGAVTFIPIDQDGTIWFVRQYRHATGDYLLELPAGTLEPGEDPALTAARESREEIGMAPSHMKAIGGFYLAPGYSNEYMHVFIATGLEPDARMPDPDEIIEIEKLSVPEVVGQLHSGGFQDAKTLAALQLADSTLGILSQS
ncbi:MAG: NUDIX hydrolase [Anaerolineales bacterium]